ncbi:unnamed protein product [Lymnaea stagnalis]|uniref:Glycosyltransferase family 92 protein n=1 Tax=Lymnaea stagnalis TaxID=6523 RepID=A0AAV2HF47_LYMST
MRTRLQCAAFCTFLLSVLSFIFVAAVLTSRHVSYRLEVRAKHVRDLERRPLEQDSTFRIPEQNNGPDVDPVTLRDRPPLEVNVSSYTASRQPFPSIDAEEIKRLIAAAERSDELIRAKTTKNTVTNQTTVAQKKPAAEKPTTKASVGEVAKATMKETIKQPPPSKDPGGFRLVSRGENIQAGDVQVHIPTAVFYNDFPEKSAFNILLNGWARHNDSMAFKCCFLHSFQNTSTKQNIVFTEAPAKVYNVYKQWIVDMQNAEFSCSVPANQLKASGVSKFSYVTFVKSSCRDASNDIMRIEFPKAVAKSVGVCLKVTYGTLNPEKMVEWFEFTKLMGVTKVFTYYFDVDPPAMKVLEYYNSTGFLDLLLIHPAKSKGGKARGFRHPRYSEQAFVDEVMGANDCKHRMSQYDYIIVMDMDEFILPKGELKTYYDILKKTSDKFPKAAGFQFDSHVIITSWGISRSSALHITRYVNRTEQANYDGAERNTRWAFKPTKTFYARNNFVYVKRDYEVAVVPHDYYMLFHYRGCKRQWAGCKSKPVTDTIMVKYEAALVDNVLKLPLGDVLYKSASYIQNITQWKLAHRSVI